MLNQWVWRSLPKSAFLTSTPDNSVALISQHATEAAFEILLEPLNFVSWESKIIVPYTHAGAGQLWKISLE